MTKATQGRVCTDCKGLLERPARRNCDSEKHREKDAAWQIVEAFVDDLQQRSGYGEVWDRTDPSIQEELYDVWASLVREVLDGQGNG